MVSAPPCSPAEQYLHLTTARSTVLVYLTCLSGKSSMEVRLRSQQERAGTLAASE